MRAGGAVPATIGVLDGEIVVGLTQRRARAVRRVGARSSGRATSPPRSCSARSARRPSAARSRCAARPGSAFMATGGLGGVHRGWPTPPDVSADLRALASTQVLVVSSGVKSLLDVPATAELLETLGVPVLGYRTDDLPLFYAAHGGPPVSARVETRRGGGRDRAGALGARRRRAPRRPPARREPRRRRAADRAGARRGGGAGRARPGGDAVRPLLPAPRERRPHAARRTAT